MFGLTRFKTWLAEKLNPTLLDEIDSLAYALSQTNLRSNMLFEASIALRDKLEYDIEATSQVVAALILQQGGQVTLPFDTYDAADKLTFVIDSDEKARTCTITLKKQEPDNGVQQPESASANNSI